MRKVILILLTLLTLSIATQISAAQTPPPTKKTNKILMYANPSTNTLIAKLEPNTRLIPIFKKGEWVKVGNPANGSVGWVNRKQVQKAREAFYRPDIQTIYINRDQTKSGKPEMNIVVYKNGKRLSSAEAKKLYKKLREQQEKQMKAMQRMTRNMNRMMNFQRFNDNGFWSNEMWIEPMFIFPESRQNTKPNKSPQGGELES